MVTRDPDASFDTPNVVIGRQDRNELTLSFRPDPYLSTLLVFVKYTSRIECIQSSGAAIDALLDVTLRARALRLGLSGGTL